MDEVKETDAGFLRRVAEYFSANPCLSNPFAEDWSSRLAGMADKVERMESLSVQTFEYDKSDNLVRIVDGDKVKRIEYDAYSRPIRIVEGDKVKTIEYDDKGRPVRVAQELKGIAFVLVTRDKAFDEEVGTTAAAKIWQKRTLKERIEQSGPHAGEPVVGDDPNEKSGFTYTPAEDSPPSIGLLNGLPVVMAAPFYVDPEPLKNDPEWVRNILMGEAQSPVLVCPQEHHLKDGKCMRDFCFCRCQKCKTDCGEI
jgi:YD repeat-containing protein